MQTTIAELLNNYEGMKDILININPKFKKLNNPVLRRTLAKVATVKQAAVAGGMDAKELLNKLRVAVRQEPLEMDDKDNEKEEPKWVATTPKESIDATKLLDEGKNPLAVAYNKIKEYDRGEVLVIVSNFKPEPLIEEFKKKGYKVYSKEVSDEIFNTFIKAK